MGTVLFASYFEVSMLSVAFVISCQTGFFFGERFFCRKRVFMFLCPFVASLCTMAYTLYKLMYFFIGIEGYSCETFKYVTGIGQGVSNALAYLFLLLKAEASNKLNPKWRYWRVGAIAVLVVNWVTLLVVCFTRESNVTAALDGQRCQFSFEKISFQIKWIVQLVSHIVFSGLFVWPLIKHMRLMGSPENVMETGGSRGNSVYHRLVNRAMWAMAISTVFTAVVTVLVFADQAFPSLFIPVVSLAILDNGLTLGSLYYASSGALSRDRQRKRSTGRIAGGEVQLRSDSMMHRSRVSSGGRAGQDSNLTSNNRGYTTDSGHVTATVQNTTATAADDVSLTQAVAPVQSSALTPLEHTTLDTL